MDYRSVLMKISHQMEASCCQFADESDSDLVYATQVVVQVLRQVCGTLGREIRTKYGKSPEELLGSRALGADDHHAVNQYIV